MAIYGYKITQGQKNSIERQAYADGQYFNPVQDINGDWFIFEAEMRAAVRNKGWAKQPMVEFVPPPSEEIPSSDSIDETDKKNK